MKVSSTSMQSLVEDMHNYTDMVPWYWISCGDKCYSFAVVEAIPLNEKDPEPEPGTQLELSDEPRVWIGSNGTRMMIYGYIAEIEEQRGGIVCAFIAAAHAYLTGLVDERKITPDPKAGGDTRDGKQC